MIYKNDEAFNFETIEDNKMTKDEIKQLWLESEKTLVVECLNADSYKWILCPEPDFLPELSYRLKEGQYFSVINGKVKKVWEDSGKTLLTEVKHPDGAWITDMYPLFFDRLIYRIKPGQEIIHNEAIGVCEKTEKYNSADAITDACEKIKNMLLNKNRKYGDSALNPVRVFSKADAGEQLKIRMDDKLSRIQSAQDDDLEDAMLDLTGYLVLDIARKLMEEKGS